MHFHPLHFGWVALPSRPKAVVVFIGGAFFGTFPTFFYRGLLRVLYDLDYVVVALPFRFTFNHWDIAISLSIYLAELKKELDALLPAFTTYENKESINAAQNLPYLWIAHSLGCKYVALLELLSESEKFIAKQEIIKALKQAQELQAKLELINADQLSLLNQPQLLVDPVITDLEAAIPWKPLAKVFKLILKVAPSRDVTFKLIEKTSLFSITKIFSLASKTAEDTISRLANVDRKPPLIPIHPVSIHLSDQQPMLGRHLAILGIRSTDSGIEKVITTNIETAYEEAVRLQSNKAALADGKAPRHPKLPSQ